MKYCLPVLDVEMGFTTTQISDGRRYRGCSLIKQPVSFNLWLSAGYDRSVTFRSTTTGASERHRFQFPFLVLQDPEVPRRDDLRRGYGEVYYLRFVFQYFLAHSPLPVVRFRSWMTDTCVPKPMTPVTVYDRFHDEHFLTHGQLDPTILNEEVSLTFCGR